LGANRHTPTATLMEGEKKEKKERRKCKIYLNVWKIHEILSNVNHKLVHEGRGNVEPINHVVKVKAAQNQDCCQRDRQQGS
jgi:hypothetical protein